MTDLYHQGVVALQLSGTDTISRHQFVCTHPPAVGVPFVFRRRDRARVMRQLPRVLHFDPRLPWRVCTVELSHASGLNLIRL